MFNRDPIRSLSRALQSALGHDLLGVDAPSAAEPRQCSACRRPLEHECDVVLFGQVWSGEALGRQNSQAAMRFEQDTIVIVGPAQDACVYVATELLYHVVHPNRRFFLDVAAHCMAPKADANVYEGRDDPVTEAVDIEIGSMLARLHAQVKTGEPDRAPAVARYLRRCAEGFDGPLREGGRPTCEATGLTTW